MKSNEDLGIFKHIFFAHLHIYFVAIHRHICLFSLYFLVFVRLNLYIY